MDDYILTQQNILQNLKYLPKNKLKEVDDFIQFLVFKSKTKVKEKSESLAGIWENIGFEKLVDIDAEIIKMRKELSKNVLNKEI